MVAVVLVYFGLIAGALGVVSLLKPLTFLKIRSRAAGALVGAGGLVLVATGFALPADETKVAVARTQLDQFVPVYQFHESHSIRINQSKERAYNAIKAVTADEIALFHTLTWIRRLGRPGPESVLQAPGGVPLLEVATRTSFLLLAEEPDHEIVVGTAVVTPPGWRPKARPTPEDFKSLHTPGFALAAMNFEVEATGPGTCVVTTDTRIYATDPSARRKFARYWRVIYPGSALIRRMWLEAIRKRAEAVAGKP